MTKAGKVFHTKSHERQKHEKYYTPAWVTECLLRHVTFNKAAAILEPAAGNGDMVRPLIAAGYSVLAYDIDPDVPTILQQNFRTVNTPYHSVATNPPFGTGGRLAFAFCWHALRLTEQRRGKVAMLLRDDFDSAGGRKLLFKEHPAFDKKIVILERIRWTNLEQKKHGPSGAHAWFIWDWTREPGPPTLHYGERR